MATRPLPLHTDALAPRQLTAEEWSDFRENCSRIAAAGGSPGEIARDMLRIGDRLTAMGDEIKQFLQQ